jgi:transcriptional regulator with XRE-family HTH domain
MADDKPIKDAGAVTPGAASLGAGLRSLRRQRGLSQRELTRLIGLSAHSNLAEYEAGRRIPPADIVSDCERVLGVTDGHLQQLRSAALAERAEHHDLPVTTGAAGAAARESGPSLTGADAGAPPAPAPGGRRFRLRRRHVLSPAGLAIISAVVVASAGLVAAADAGGHGIAAASLSPNGTRLTDNVDPEQSACNLDAVDIGTAPLHLDRAVTVRGQHLAAGTVVGVLELRYSPACHAAWARLTPVQSVARPGLGSVAAGVVRPADGRHLQYGFRQIVEIYGNMLLTGPGCVSARGSITFTAGAAATAATPCAT